MSKQFLNSTKGGSMPPELDNDCQVSKSNNKILRVVEDFLKVHDQLEGKYWPMVDLFVERLEKGIPAKKISKDFYKAYMQAKGVTAWQDIPNYWYKTVGRVQRVALQGREWITKHKARGLSFWKLIELADFTPLKKHRRRIKLKRNPLIANLVEAMHVGYFIDERPDLFPVLCAAFLEAGKLPGIAREKEQQRAYERLCIRMLNILLNDATFFFSSKDNWPDICARILGQVEPSQFPRIIDIETN
jgi:hypothetical protein